MYSDKISQAQNMVAKNCPKLAENRIVYESILQLYSDSALIEADIKDLNELLQSKRIKSFKTSAKTFKECVYNLLDEFPEITASKGILRYYETSPDFDWQDLEKAEIAFGDALTQDTYGWRPDFWTVFERKTQDSCGLTMIVAF